MLITANQPFGEWGKIFPDPAITLAAVDRLVLRNHLARRYSYRRRAAAEKSADEDAPPHTPLSSTPPPLTRRDNQPRQH